MSNAADAIKIACNFISMDNLIETRRLVDEFRQQRLSTKEGDVIFGDDVLQLYTTMWYTWLSLSPQYQTNSPEDLSSTSECPESSAGLETETRDLDLVVESDPSSGPMEVDSDVVAAIPSADVTLPSAGVLRRREQRKMKRALVAANRPHKPGHDFTCPFSTSQRAFNLGGLVDHL